MSTVSSNIRDNCKREKAPDITALESEIDRHVSALYHLTPDEIEIVEGR
jgi:hypothetical protein